jgi:ribosomal protein L17
LSGLLCKGKAIAQPDWNRSAKVVTQWRDAGLVSARLLVFTTFLADMHTTTSSTPVRFNLSASLANAPDAQPLSGAFAKSREVAAECVAETCGKGAAIADDKPLRDHQILCESWARRYVSAATHEKKYGSHKLTAAKEAAMAASLNGLAGLYMDGLQPDRVDWLACLAAVCHGAFQELESSHQKMYVESRQISGFRSLGNQILSSHRVAANWPRAEATRLMVEKCVRDAKTDGNEALEAHKAECEELTLTYVSAAAYRSRMHMNESSPEDKMQRAVAMNAALERIDVLFRRDIESDGVARLVCLQETLLKACGMLRASDVCTSDDGLLPIASLAGAIHVTFDRVSHQLAEKSEGEGQAVPGAT